MSMPIGEEKRMKLTFWRDMAREWRWNLRATNGRIVATSGEGYKRFPDAKAGWDLTMQGHTAELDVEPDATDVLH